MTLVFGRTMRSPASGTEEVRGMVVGAESEKLAGKDHTGTCSL